MGFKMQYQPDVWSCVATAFSMCFDVPVRKLIGMVGHDGSEILWPRIPEPHNRRGFHLQEMVDVGFLLGFAVLIIESEITLYSNDPIDIRNVKSRLSISDYLEKCEGVILGVWPNGLRHAVAYSRGVCFDPSGDIYELTDDVTIRVFCPVLKSNHFSIVKDSLRIGVDGVSEKM